MAQTEISVLQPALPVVTNNYYLAADPLKPIGGGAAASADSSA
jgi:hypothetical protein